MGLQYIVQFGYFESFFAQNSNSNATGYEICKKCINKLKIKPSVTQKLLTFFEKPIIFQKACAKNKRKSKYWTGVKMNKIHCMICGVELPPTSPAFCPKHSEKLPIKFIDNINYATCSLCGNPLNRNGDVFCQFCLEVAKDISESLNIENITETEEASKSKVANLLRRAMKVN